MATIKVIEIIGESSTSWEDAAQSGVLKAAKTLENITGVEVNAMTAKVENGMIVQYRATLKIAFVLKEE